MDKPKLKDIIEAALLAAGRPLSVDQILALFIETDTPSRDDIRNEINQLGEEYAGRGIEIVQVASGYRLQVKKELAPWVSRLWEEKPARYTRALLETLALVAYRQPITRGEIEDVRGVAVSSNIIRTLMEREWIRVLGHRDVPGKPAMYGTTKEFLDYFNLKSLADLPSLQELRDIDSINAELDLDDMAPPVSPVSGEEIPEEIPEEASAEEASAEEASAEEASAEEASAEEASAEEASAEEASAEEAAAEEAAAEEAAAEEAAAEEAAASDEEAEMLH